jgi:hypothetical protein
MVNLGERSARTGPAADGKKYLYISMACVCGRRILEELRDRFFCPLGKICRCGLSKRPARPDCLTGMRPILEGAFRQGDLASPGTGFATLF